MARRISDADVLGMGYCLVNSHDCTKHRQLGFACGQRLTTRKKAPLRILPDKNGGSGSAKVSLIRSVRNMKQRRPHSKAPCHDHSQHRAIEPAVDLHMPPNSVILSWLRCRPSTLP